MTIQDNIGRKIEEVENDVTGRAGEKLRGQAVAAMYAGQGSDEWLDFMKNFADPPDNPIQLARLTAVDDPGCSASPYIREARAYLMANVTCGTPTFTTTMRGVDDVLDKTLSPPPPSPLPADN